MRNIEFDNYTAEKFITKEYNALVDKIKKGTKESSSLSMELKEIFEEQKEDIFSSPEVDILTVKEEDIPEGKIVATNTGFLIMNSGDSFVLLGRRKSVSLDDEALAKFEDIIKNKNKGATLSEEDEDTLAELRSVGAIQTSALDKLGLLKVFKQKIEEAGCKEAVVSQMEEKYFQEMGTPPPKPLKFTQKMITDLSIPEAEDLDRKIGFNFFPRLYESGYSKPQEEKVYRGLKRGVSFRDFETESGIFDSLREDTKDKLLTAKSIFTKIEESLPSLDVVGKIESLKKMDDFWKKEKKALDDMDLSSFLEENASNDLFSPINMIKLDCDKKTPSEFTRTKLVKKELLKEESIEELELKAEMSISISFFKADSSLENISIYAEFLRKMQDTEMKKQKQKGQDNEKKGNFLSL